MWLLVALSLLAAAPPAPPKDDVVYLLNGDRITGQTLSKGKPIVLMQTAYGRISLPRGRIQKIVYGDGHEELVNAPPPPPLPPPPAEPALNLVLALSGQAFWQAWPRPKDHDIDATLKLSVRLDDQPVVVYTDSHLDPGDLPGAIVNSFSFAPEDLTVAPADGIVADPPETKQGGSFLRIHIPSSRAGIRHLVLAYQSNSATQADPRFQDLVTGDAQVDLEKEAPVTIRVDQERGRMEYSGFLGLLNKRMRNVETFRVDLHGGLAPSPAPSQPSPPPSPEP